MIEQSGPLDIAEVMARRRARKLRAGLLYLSVLIVVVWSVEATIIADTEWDRIGSVSQVLDSTLRFFAVDWSILPSLVKPAMETLMIACLGTLLGVVICVPVAWFGALNITPFKPVTYPIARFMMTLSRSIHEIVWALIFVAGVGLGSFAGVLAIAMRSVGFIAKMASEAIEDIDKEPVAAIRPVVIGVIIFEWEINIRRSAVLGLVGAGGLGLAFFRQMNTFNHPGVTTVILTILALILLGEVLSYFTRRAVI